MQTSFRSEPRKFSGNKLFPVAPLASAILLSTLSHQAEARVVWAISPSLSIAAVHDDNIFVQPEPAVDDRIMRYTPGLTVDYTRDELNIVASYSQDAEYYEDNDQLDSSSLRRIAVAALTYDVSPRLRLGLDASYFKTPTPGELNLGDGLIQLGRVPTTRHTAGASAEYAFSPTFDGTFAYNGTSDETELGVGGDTHEGRMEFSKALSARNSLLFGYTYRQFEFDDPTADEQDSHTALVGWEHQFSPRTMFSILAGPRYFGDDVEPAVDMSLVHEFLTGEITASYSRSETLLAGSTSRVESEFASVAFTKRFGNNLTLSLAPVFGEAESEQGSRVKVRQLGADLRYSFNDYVAVSANWQGSRQVEHIVGDFRRDLPRDVAYVALHLTYPIRRERP